MEKKTKIGIFTGYALPHLGGVERYVDKLSGSLEQIGYEIIIITSNHAGLSSVEQQAGRKTYRLPILNLAKDRYPIPKRDSHYKKLVEQVENENIDIYLLNTRFHLTSLVGARMGKRQKKPVMLIEHGTDHFTVNNYFLDYIGKIYEHLLTSYLKRNIDRFYGVSKKCNQWLEHFGIKSSGVFYNSVDKADSVGVRDLYDVQLRKDALVITYAGRLIKEKGIINLINAFLIINENSDKILELMIAGDGDLLEFITDHYKNKNIHVLGRLDFEHIMSLFKRTDIFVYPSLYPEGLPTSILEAALMNCAIIATPRGGTEEVISDLHHGIIINGSTESLQLSLSQLIENGAKRKMLASMVHRRVIKVFSWSATAKAVDREIKKF